MVFKDLLPSKVQLTFFNTETRQKELFEPINSQVKMYTCGPTVYNFAHIGNFRTYIFEDILRRTLKFFGLQVIQVMNLTDIDDKTLRGAIAMQVSLEEFTQPYKKAFFEDLHTLGIEPAEYYPAATHYVEEMIAFIQKLMDKGIAYSSKDGSIYYSIDKFPRYGCLSHLKLEDLQENGSQRVSSDEYEKDNAADFVLWKAYDSERDGKIFWESPFGKGRPGWHLECSTMAMSLLGDTIDIHVGAVDNIFPHHENEIAQSEACSGKRFVRLWMHSEHLVVNHKKMSKSLGNFYTLRDLLDKGYTGMHIRYMLLQTHYKTPLNFTFEALDAAKNSLQRINDFIARLGDFSSPVKEPSQSCHELLEKAQHTFAHAMADDLNISVALAALFDMIHAINSLYDKKQLTGGDVQETFFLLEQFNKILGVCDFEASDKNIPQALTEALKQRNEARLAKNWARADELRTFILQNGYLIEDTATGARLKKLS